MDKRTLETVMNTSLFRGADRTLVENIIDKNAPSFTYSGEEQLSPPRNNEKHLVVILSGKADVFSADSERKVLIRSLGKGDIFGVAELFGQCEAEVSRVVAKGKCTALFIGEEKVKMILEQDKRVMYNYLNFLSCRIRFLNKRIACFTAGSAERRLAFYLDALAEEKDGCENSAQVCPEVSMNALALMLDIGRASLYRAIETLEKDGFIEKDNKSFFIKDRKNMLKKYTK